MNQCSIFKLNVFRTGSDCKFQLMENNQQPIFASLKHPEKLNDLYNNWKRSYPKAYDTPQADKTSQADDTAVKGKVKSLSLTLPSNGKHIAEHARKALLEEFNQWLGDVNLRKIRERIYSEAAGKNSQNQKTGGNCVDLLIACECPELTRLPWEAWEIASKKPIHISRTRISTGDEGTVVKNNLRPGKPRILAVLADTSELNLNKDRQAVQLLKKVAAITWVKRQERENGEQFKDRFIKELVDERGWDVLIFAGHSDETELTGGKFKLASDVIVSISEIEEELIQAKHQGLQVAIFNSCSGLSIADSLIKLGLPQVVVMREKSHDSANHVFLKHLCQSLADYKDIQEAFQDGCNYLKLERNAYPSGYLIPSLFRHPDLGTELFRIEPLGLQRVWRDWKLSRKEAIALSILVLLSLMVPVQDLLLDVRTFVQAVYRDNTKQLPRKVLPPVLLIAIDQESINEASQEIEGFKTRPMERQYLAQLVDHLSELQVKTIGIDYLLNKKEPRQKKLDQSIKNAVEQQGVWFVFAVNELKNWKVFPKTASPKWSLQGDINFFPSDVKLPEDATCKKACPFAYLLAFSHLLNQNPSLAGLPQPNLQSREDFRWELSNYLMPKNDPNSVITQNSVIASLKELFPPFGLRSIIDFSIPPNHAYDRMSSEQFLKSTSPNSELQQRIEKQVVIIASGGYEEASDKFSLPLAVSYWRDSQNFPQPEGEDLPDAFTGGEAHAYMVHHLLSQHRVVLIPDLWMTLLAALLGKGMTLVLLKHKHRERQQRKLLLVGATATYGIVGLQTYIWASISIPVFLPSAMFWVLVSINSLR